MTFDVPPLPPEEARLLPPADFELLLRSPLTGLFDEELLPRPFSPRGEPEDLG